MQGDYKEFVAEVVKKLRDAGHKSAAFGIWALFCAGDLNGDNPQIIGALAQGGPVAAVINLILNEQRQPASLPVRCEHGRRWGWEFAEHECGCASPDGGPCKHCGRDDCQNSSTAAAARALTAEQRRADPELAERVDRARRSAGATCRRHVEAARSAMPAHGDLSTLIDFMIATRPQSPGPRSLAGDLGSLIDAAVANLRDALMLPLELARRGGDPRVVEGIESAFCEIQRLDDYRAAALRIFNTESVRIHKSHSNLTAATPADVPIDIGLRWRGAAPWDRPGWMADRIKQAIRQRGES